MIIEHIKSIRNNVKDHSLLIHCITNPISINQCANAILCVGAKPIMAEYPDEVSEITKTANAVMLNLGNITDTRMKSIMLSSKVAHERQIPSVLDVVGIACSTFRKNYAYELLDKYVPTVIKGNYSEMNALYDSDYTSIGVDSDLSLDTRTVNMFAIHLAKKYRSIILATGETDIITDGKKLIHIKNGNSQLSAITGTGCMLGALCATFLAIFQGIEAIVCACAVLEIAGELAQTNSGNGTFMTNLIDKLSVLSHKDIEKHLKLEEIQIENI